MEEGAVRKALKILPIRYRSCISTEIRQNVYPANFWRLLINNGNKESVILILFYSVVFLVIFIDQLSKYWIRAQLNVGETMVIWEGILNFTHIQNSGAAGGIFEGYGRLFVPVAIIIAVVSIYMLKKGHINGRLLQTGVALYVGGAIGNAIDRVLFNQVTDFIHFSFRDGIPNLADYALVFGIVLIFVDVVIGWVRKRKKTADLD